MANYPITSKNSRSRFLKILLAITALCLCALLVSLNKVFSIRQDQQTALNEYVKLREQFAPVLPKKTDPAAELKKINSEYVGWIRMPNANIDYPIARTTDNETYLHTTFEGNPNPAGAIFMDHRNVQDFGSKHVILFGHMMKNGTMFGNLHLYLEPDYLKNNPTISITTANGDTLSYRIFSAKAVDAWDSCYQVDFEDDEEFLRFTKSIKAPKDVSSLLTLSTCTPRGGYDDRIVVHAVLVEESEEPQLLLP